MTMPAAKPWTHRKWKPQATATLKRRATNAPSVSRAAAVAADADVDEMSGTIAANVLTERNAPIVLKKQNERTVLKNLNVPNAANAPTVDAADAATAGAIAIAARHL